MGYDTDFGGEFAITPPLDAAQVAYLEKFNSTRRMRRNPELAESLPDPERHAINLPIGDEAAYFVGGVGTFGQGEDSSVLDGNRPPNGQPGLWCQWVPNGDGTELVWDEGEKFYNYVEWLEYLIGHFFGPWGRTLNGEVWWRGSEDEDRGTIYVKDNIVEAVGDEISNPGPSWGRESNKAAM